MVFTLFLATSSIDHQYLNSAPGGNPPVFLISHFQSVFTFSVVSKLRKTMLVTGTELNLSIW